MQVLRGCFFLTLNQFYSLFISDVSEILPRCVWFYSTTPLHGTFLWIRNEKTGTPTCNGNGRHGCKWIGFRIPDSRWHLTEWRNPVSLPNTTSHRYRFGRWFFDKIILSVTGTGLGRVWTWLGHSGRFELLIENKTKQKRNRNTNPTNGVRRRRPAGIRVSVLFGGPVPFRRSMPQSSPASGNSSHRIR